MVIGIAAAAASGAAGAWEYAPLAGWDVAALSYTGWLWLSVIAVMTAAQTATHATCEDLVTGREPFGSSGGSRNARAD